MIRNAILAQNFSQLEQKPLNTNSIFNGMNKYIDEVNASSALNGRSTVHYVILTLAFLSFGTAKTIEYQINTQWSTTIHDILSSSLSRENH